MEMKPSIDLSISYESRNGLYMAHYLPGLMEGWGVGSITAPEFDQATMEMLAHAAMESIEDVPESELPYSDCTDGRQRTQLEDGQPVPNREKLVGADIAILFMMAEALGSRFYADPEAPLEDRLTEVATFADGRDIKVSTHTLCGMVGSFVGVLQNNIRFAQVPGYVERQKQLLPNGVYDQVLHDESLAGWQRRLEQGRYDDWNDALVRRVVEKISGKHAVAGLLDDGHGIHGHLEVLIARLNTPGAAINPNTFIELSGGHQVFSNNDNRRTSLARQFGRGEQDDDYKIAEMAGEDGIDAGHGSLSAQLPTLVIERAA